MIYAPVAIATLNRTEHFKRCVESLAKSPLAKETELFISLDYPPAEKYVEGYKTTKAYIEAGIEGFKKVHVYYQDKNLGSVRNSMFIQEKAFESFDRVIHSEDDNEFSPCFIDYIDKALEQYEGDDSILGVYCNKPRIVGEPKAEDGTFKVNFFSAYGVGLWRETEKTQIESINRAYIEDLCCSKSKLKTIRKKHPEAICYLCSTLLRKEPIYQTPGGEILPIDTAKIIYAVAEDKFQICTPVRMGRNWGYDGSGANCDASLAMRSDVYISEEENCPVRLNDNPVFYKTNYPLKANRIIPYISANVRIWVWRIIAKRKMHE